MMRRAIALVVAMAGIVSFVGAASAQDWPNRPVTMVVGFAAGGGTDVLGRILGKRLSELLGQPVPIENVAGAGGMVGSARVAKAPPDGSQFVLGSRADTINQKLHSATVAAMETSSVQDQLMASGAIVVAPERRSTAYFNKFVESEIERNGAPLKAAGIQLEGSWHAHPRLVLDNRRHQIPHCDDPALIQRRGT